MGEESGAGMASSPDGQPDRNIVHDLRQSLGTIMALAGAARLQAGVPSPVVDLLQSIESEVERASDISRRLAGDEP